MKTTWRYQIMRYDDGTLGVHEYYSDGGYTRDPIITGETEEELLKTLDMIKNDIENGGVINYTPPQPGRGEEV